MTRSNSAAGPTFKFYTQLFFPHFGRTLLGLYFVLVEMSESEVMSTSGSYGCRAIGRTSTCRPIDLRPDTPTQIHTPQLRLVVQKGDNVYLPCTVYNLGANQVLWRHADNIIAGSNLTGFPRGRSRLLPDFTLELSRVSSKDDGKYDCIVTAPYGHMVNISHTLTVLDPPTLIIEPDTGSVIVSEGDSVQIGCIPRGNPTPHITWSKQEGTIPIHPSWFTQRRILIENVSAKETGVYICKADNRVGRPATGSIYVRVLLTTWYIFTNQTLLSVSKLAVQSGGAQSELNFADNSPEVNTPKRRVHGGVRQSVQLVCLVHADPKAEVQWLFGQKPVPLSRRVWIENQGDEHYLNIRSVHEKDFGSYLCIANNSYGYDMKHIEFSGVPNAPVVTRWETSGCRQESLSVTVSTADSSAQDRCTVSVRLFWVVECYSSLIDYRLHFRSVTMNQPVTSANEDQVPPWTELTIPADPTSPATFLHSKSYTIHGLPNNTIYEGAVRARNKFGWSFLSPVFYFTSVPNSSLKMSEMKEALTSTPDIETWKKSIYQNPKDRLSHPDPGDEVQSTFSENSSRRIITSFHIFLISVFVSNIM